MREWDTLDHNPAACSLGRIHLKRRLPRHMPCRSIHQHPHLVLLCVRATSALAHTGCSVTQERQALYQGCVVVLSAQLLLHTSGWVGAWLTSQPLHAPSVSSRSPSPQR